MKLKIFLIFLIVLISPVSLSLKMNDIFIPKSETKSYSAGSGSETTLYIYANNQRIAKHENNNIYYFHNDHLGSPRIITDSNGNVVEEIDYLPFGDELTSSDEKIKYNSKELDQDTNLNYYGARYYDSSIGRFIIADTVKGRLTDSQSLNLYAYVKNNPIKYIDPSGNQERMNRNEAISLIREVGIEIWAATMPRTEPYLRDDSTVAGYLSNKIFNLQEFNFEAIFQGIKWDKNWRKKFSNFVVDIIDIKNKGGYFGKDDMSCAGFGFYLLTEFAAANNLDMTLVFQKGTDLDYLPSGQGSLRQAVISYEDQGNIHIYTFNSKKLMDLNKKRKKNWNQNYLYSFHTGVLASTINIAENIVPVTGEPLTKENYKKLLFKSKIKPGTLLFEPMQSHYGHTTVITKPGVISLAKINKEMNK